MGRWGGRQEALGVAFGPGGSLNLAGLFAGTIDLGSGTRAAGTGETRAFVAPVLE